MPDEVPSDIKPLQPPPTLDGPLAELSFGRLTASIDWLVDSVKLLEQGLFQVAGKIKGLSSGNGPDPDLLSRMSNLEAAQIETQTTLRQQVEALVGPLIAELEKKPPTPVPSEKSEPPPPEPVVIEKEFDYSVLNPITDEVNALKNNVEEVKGKVEAQEEIEKSRKPPEVPDPFADLNKQLSSLGLYFGEGSGVDALGKVLLDLKNDVHARPAYKDLEDQKQALEDKITEVEQAAAADSEARSQAAAEDCSRLDERLVRVENTVQELVAKNEADGDVAGRLRGLTLRVDAIEEREVENAEARMREDELQAEMEENKSRVKKALTLEDLGKVDLHEEVRRLRSMMECMEAAMPPEARQTLAFFKKGPGAAERSGTESRLSRTFTGGAEAPPGLGGTGASPIGFGGAGASFSDEDLVSFRAATDELISKHAAAQQREIQKITLKMKVTEKEHSALDSKVDDMWRRMPKVIALLEPLQAFMNQTGALGPGEKLGDGLADVVGSDADTAVHSGPTSGRTGSLAEERTAPEASSIAAGDSPKSPKSSSARSRKSPSPPVSASAVAPPPAKGLPPPAAWLSLGNATSTAPKMSPLVTGPTATGQAEMNVLTNVIRTALQKSLEDIHSDLMEELQRLRTEFQNLVGNKAPMSELLGLKGRVDAWSQQQSRFPDRQNTGGVRDERSISPMSDTTGSRSAFAESMKNRTKMPTATAASPVSEKKKGYSCHEKCKEPTCPAAMRMSQSLSRLPALKSMQ